jgi:CBS domain-containing protein
MIEKPITFLPHQRVSVIQNSIKENGWTFTSFPVVDEEGKLLGLVTRDELNFVESILYLFIIINTFLFNFSHKSFS